MTSLTDTRFLHFVRQISLDLLADDPDLSKPEHILILDQVGAFWQQTGELS
jgi:hypothetical protein